LTQGAVHKTQVQDSQDNWANATLIITINP